MLDPLPPPPPLLSTLISPLATHLHLPTLPHHIHEVLLGLLLYQTVQSLISPLLSTYLFPTIYKNLNRRTKINWDVHVVSLVQSLLINTLALWVMWRDEERSGMGGSVLERVYGYTGASGLIQGLACGYFVWDLVVSTRYFGVFGVGIWLHAVTALCVFGFGFRPFCNYYGPVFILYELSSPFLNVHWFCDKLNLTGSKLQWYNGIVLLFTFFCCRLVWGTYQSIRVYYDVYQIMNINVADVLHQGQDIGMMKSGSSVFANRNGQLCMGEANCVRAQSEVMKFVDETSHVPYWIIAVYLVSNTTLNALNWYWFGKMIETVRKRFRGAGTVESEKSFAMGTDSGHGDGDMKGSERRKSVVEHAADTLDREVLTGPGTPGAELSERAAMGMGLGMSSGRAVNADGGAEVGRRRKDI